jgi:hypothetical protein
VAATDTTTLRRGGLGAWLRAMSTMALRALGHLLGLAGGLLWHGQARAVDLPADHAEAMVHVYNGGGITASGPALLVRKSLLDKVSLTGTYYVDMVSNASIDVVTTASPFKEKRTAFDIGADYVVRDTRITLGRGSSREPDYQADSVSLDMAQETFGGMTTVNLGFTRAWDKVGKQDEGFFDQAKHWQYRLGLTQILTQRWLASANLEVVSDSGFLGNPYRVARVFGAAVAERTPRTRSSRALALRAQGDVGDAGLRQAVHAEYRYFWDTWDIKAHTVELGYSRYFGDDWLADAFVRWHSQGQALFYSDNATLETRYISRNRQLSDFSVPSLGAKLTWTLRSAPAPWDVKFTGALEYKDFRYRNFTDPRTGRPYSHAASVLQLYVSANY